MATVLPAGLRSRCRQTSGELTVLLNSGESSYVPADCNDAHPATLKVLSTKRIKGTCLSDQRFYSSLPKLIFPGLGSTQCIPRARSDERMLYTLPVSATCLKATPAQRRRVWQHNDLSANQAERIRSQHERVVAPVFPGQSS